jgi:hypothetical protein
MQIYKVLDGMTGLYVDCATKEEALDKVAEYALQYWLRFTHGFPYSIETANEDGSVTWRNPLGEEIPNDQEIRAAMIARMGQQLQSIAPANVESF